MTPNAIHGWAKALLRLADSWEHAEWLVDRINEGCTRRPTPIEMRRIYAQDFRPADGIRDIDADLSDLVPSYTKKASGD